MASFAGFAPVSNPAITVAVIIDTPTVGSRYGAETSAPVFREVAQQVLEYLGVPHDQPLKMVAANAKGSAGAPLPAAMVEEDGPSEAAGDLNALYAEANVLPADDPLHPGASGTPTAAAERMLVAPAPQIAVAPTRAAGVFAALPAGILKAFREHGGSSWMPEEAEVKPLPKPAAAAQVREDGAVVVDSTRKVAVPVFDGTALRGVIEKAAVAGLRVQPVGSGVAKEQVPAAGTMVPMGTEVIVRFAR